MISPSNKDPVKRQVSDVTSNTAGMEEGEGEPAAVMSDAANALLVGSSSSGETPLPQDPSLLESTEQALEWVNHYYPTLSFQNIENVEFKGLNSLEFFDVFLADDAPFTFCEFQKKRQDKNIRYGKWEDLAGRVKQPSLVHAAAQLPSPQNSLPEETTTTTNKGTIAILTSQLRTTWT